MGMKKSENVRSRSEKKIGKAKPITLLSIIGVIMAFVIVMTFIRFPIGVKNYNSVVGAIDLDYDIAGGSAYTLTLSDDNIEEVDNVESVLETLRYRMRELGYNVFNVKALRSTEEGVEDYEIRIEAKDTDSLSSDIAVVAAYGEISITGGTSQSGNPEILTDIDVVESSEYLGSQSDGETTSYVVGITFTEEAHDEIIRMINEAASAENSSSTSFYMGIKLGETTLLSEGAVSADYFDGRTLTVNSSSETSAKQMALQMNSGGLAYKYDVSDGVSVSSPYGEKIALKCLIVILALLLIAFVFFAVMYKGFGVIMILSLIAFALIEALMLIAVPGITLSIGGVIGIGAAIILTSFAIMLIGNSIKAEFVNTEKTVKAAIKKGFRDTVLSIASLFVVGAVVAGALLIFATGGLNCFAITFGIGTIIGAFSAIVLTRMFSSLILPIAGYSEKFLGVKRVEDN